MANKLFTEAVDILSDDDKRFDIVKSLLNNQKLLGAQIEGFEQFVKDLLTDIVTENPEIWVDTPNRCRRDCVKLLTPTVLKPRVTETNGEIKDIYPNEAQQRKMTYENSVIVDIEHTHFRYETGDMEQLIGEPIVEYYRNVKLAQFPCMVGSKYCNWYNKNKDPANLGGYFVIGGHQKMMVLLQKMRTNWPVTRHVTKPPAARVTVAEVRSANGKWRSTSTLNVRATSNGGGDRVNILFNIPFILRGTSPLDIPLPIVLQILRRETFEEQFKCIVPDVESTHPKVVNALKHALMVPESQFTREEAMAWLFREGSGSCRDKERSEENMRYYIIHILANEFIPHGGTHGVDIEQRVRHGGRGEWTGHMKQYEKKKSTLEEIKQECGEKSVYLGFVVMRLLYIYLGLYPEDDRDHYSTKRLDSPGPLMAYHFRLNYRTLLRQLPSALSKTLQRCPSIIDCVKTKAKALAMAMREPFKRGNWSMQPGINTGVVQSLDRINPHSSLGLCQRIMTPLKKEGKIALPRQLHLSHWGINCCCETPEGQACGLILVIAMYCRVGKGVPMPVMIDVITNNFGPNSIDPIIRVGNLDINKDVTLIFINGRYFGTTDKPERLERTIITMRRSQDISFETRVIWHRTFPMSKYFFINSDCSVALRPVYVVENLHKLPYVYHTSGTHEILWNRLLNHGCIEYIDKEEETARKLVVACNPKELREDKQYSHCEIDPTAIMGLMANLIPYSDHNQSPRNMYQCAQRKQALSISSISRHRGAMHQFELMYPSKPISATKIDRYVTEHVGGIPSGQEVMFMIGCWDGRNQEDSIYLSRSAVERGLFRCTYYKQFKSEARSRGNEDESFEIPHINCIGRRPANYSKLNTETGIIDVGTYVEAGDVLIGKVSRCPDEFDSEGNSIVRYYDKSVVMSKIQSGYVDKVTRTTTGHDGHPLVEVIIRQTRCPIVGDKFASRHAQKGTVGGLITERDLPYSTDGKATKPDVIMNPAAIPTRMTIGQVIEIVTGMKACRNGIAEVDGTPFQNYKDGDTFNIKALAEEMERLGIGYKTKMIDGRTGKMMTGAMFIGPCYYLRLKHMVMDKRHSRSTGPMQILTRQPTEGRSKNGGIRLGKYHVFFFCLTRDDGTNHYFVFFFTGEMEKDAIMAHGASGVLQERLIHASDGTPTVICKLCGGIAEHPHSTRFGVGKHSGSPYCRNCDSTDCETVMFPFASAVLVRELQALGVAFRQEVTTVGRYGNSSTE